MRKTVWMCALLSLLDSAVLFGQTVTLADAIHAAEANNRVLQVATLDRDKTVEALQIARTRRWPTFSLTALGSQPLTQLGITLARGSLGVYPDVGPIPGRTTTLEDPLRFGFIGFASIAQPLTQQYKIGLGIALSHAGVEAATEQMRAKQQATINEVRHLYYAIVQGESGKQTLRATVDFLTQLQRETSQQVIQRVALQADLLDVNAKLAEAEYGLLRIEDSIQTETEKLNRAMGRPVDALLEIDPSSIADSEDVTLQEAYTEALASRPEIRLAKIQQRTADLERRVARAERWPEVSLSFIALRTVNFSSTLPNNLSSLGLQGTWDVFDWGRKRREAETRDKANAQAAVELTDAEALVMIDVGRTYRSMTEARKELELARALQSSSRETLRVTRNRYAQRQAVLSEVVRVQSDLAQADHRYTQALMNLATAQADFEKALGRDQ